MIKKIRIAMLPALALFVGPTTSTLAAEVGNLDTNLAAVFTEDLSSTPSLDPNDPTKEIDTGREGTPGPLSLDVAPSLIDFGTHKLKAGYDEIIKAKPMRVKDSNGLDKEVANFTQVTDKRGGRLGWTLNVKQLDQLKSATDDVLTGAMISFKNANIISPSTETAPTGFSDNLDLVPGSDTTIMSAKPGAGYLTWLQVYGKLVDNADATAKLNDGIELSIPSGSAQAKAYTGKLMWSLSDTPG